MTIQRKSLGKRAEEEAVKFLSNMGWKLLQRNYRCRIGELDIVARDRGGVIVFVEVRCRSGISHGLPEESVTYAKQVKIKKIASHYLLTHPAYQSIACRFDVLAMYFNPLEESFKVNHITNAF